MPIIRNSPDGPKVFLDGSERLPITDQSSNPSFPDKDISVDSIKDYVESQINTGQTNLGVNIGSGTNVFAGMNGTNLEFRGIQNIDGKIGIALDGLQDDITLTINEASFDIDLFTETTTSKILTDVERTKIANAITGASNLGAGEGIYTNTVNNSLSLKSIAAADGSVTVTSVSDEIRISANNNGTVTGGLNIGTGADVFSSTVSGVMQFRRLNGLNGINASQILNSVEFSVNEAQFDLDLIPETTDSKILTSAERVKIGNSVIGGNNLGTGVYIYKQKANDLLYFRSLSSPDSSVGIALNGDNIELTAAEGSITGGAHIGSGGSEAVYSGVVSDVLQFKGVIQGVGSPVLVSSDASDILLGFDLDLVNETANSKILTSSERDKITNSVTGAVNIGLTGRDIFDSKSGDNLQFRSITGYRNMLAIYNGANETIRIEADETSMNLDFFNQGTSNFLLTGVGHVGSQTGDYGLPLYDVTSGGVVRAKSIKGSFGNRVSDTGTGLFIQFYLDDVNETATRKILTDVERTKISNAVTGGVSVGTGSHLFFGKNGDDLEFRRVLGIGSIDTSDFGTDLEIIGHVYGKNKSGYPTSTDDGDDYYDYATDVYDTTNGNFWKCQDPTTSSAVWWMSDSTQYRTLLTGSSTIDVRLGLNWKHEIIIDKNVNFTNVKEGYKGVLHVNNTDSVSYDLEIRLNGATTNVLVSGDGAIPASKEVTIDNNNTEHVLYWHYFNGKLYINSKGFV